MFDRKKWRIKNREKINAKQRHRYMENKNSMIARENGIKKRKERYDEKRQYINVYKRSKGCAMCGYNKCASALDFHHYNSENKKFNITAICNRSLKDIKKEIMKCAVLCKNCHAELHAGVSR